MKEPLVSILMPAYNAERFIREAIESIQNQGYSNWELLILDDASTDPTLQVVKAFQDDRIKVFKHEKNLGYLLSCNELFEKAEGDFITFLDADDTCSSNRISTCLSEFETDSSLDFVTNDHFRTDELGKLVSEHNADIDYYRYASDPIYYPTICCATTFLRKELLRKVGGYHPFFKEIGGEDYHWLFRLSRGGKGRHLSEVLYNYRQHAAQVHNQNQNPLKYFAQDIDQEIRQELIGGKDLLIESEHLCKKWATKIDHEPSKLHLRMAAEALNQGKTGRFLSYLFKATFSFPLRFSNAQNAAYLLYSFFARIA